MSDAVIAKRIAKNTIFLYIRMLLILVVTLYTSRVVLRTLGIVDYGVYNVVAGFVLMFAFMNASLSHGIQRFYNYVLGEKDKDGIRKIYLTSLVIQSIISLFLFIALETFGLWYISNEMVIPNERLVAAYWVFHCSAVSLILMMMQMPYSAAIIAYERMDYYALVGLVDVLLKLGIVYILPMVSIDKLQLYGVLMLTVAFVDFFMYFIYARIHIPELRLQLYFDKKLFVNMLSFSGWNIFGTFAFMLKGQGLNVLLNAFFGPVVNAARGIASQVMSGLQGFSVNVLMAFRPQLIQSYAAKDFNRVRVIFFCESKISYLFLYAMMCPVVIELDYILALWLGKDMIPEHTKMFTILILINMLISAFHQPLTHIVHATGKQKVFQLVNAMIICAILPVSWVFLHLGFEPESAFIVSLALTIINIAISILIVRGLFSFSIRQYVYEVFSPCLRVTLLLPVLPLFIHMNCDEGFMRLVYVVFTEIAIGIPVVYRLALNKTEKDMVKRLINLKLIKLIK